MSARGRRARDPADPGRTRDFARSERRTREKRQAKSRMPRAGNRRRRARRAGKDARGRLEGVTHGSSRRFAWLRWVCPARWASESAPGGRANFELRGGSLTKESRESQSETKTAELPRRTGASHRPVRGPWLPGGGARFGALVGAPARDEARMRAVYAAASDSAREGRGSIALVTVMRPVAPWLGRITRSQHRRIRGSLPGAS